MTLYAVALREGGYIREEACRLFIDEDEAAAYVDELLEMDDYTDDVYQIVEFSETFASYELVNTQKREGRG